MRTRYRWLAVIAVVFLFTLGALAQTTHHLSVRVVPKPAWAMFNGPDVATKLFQLSLGMALLPPVDGSGNDEWPCFAGSADCSTIAAGGVVIGTPLHTWPLSACDANTPTSANCGQIFWFYEDDTGDNISHLIVSIVAKQGLNLVLDTGNFDFGPNPFPAGSIIIIFDDTAFGTLGQTGANNGFCNGSNKTCIDPVAGPVAVTVTTKIGTQKISGKFTIALQ